VLDVLMQIALCLRVNRINILQITTRAFCTTHTMAT
jgi:hypothetical protein